MQMEGSYVLSVVLTGLTVVFVALILLIAFVWLMGKIFEAIGKSKSEKVEKKAAPEKSIAPAQDSAPAPVVEDGISDEVVAVIAAAVASMSGGFAVKSIKKSSAKTSRRGAWGAQGVAENTRVF